MADLLWKAVGRDWTSRGGVRWAVGSTVVHSTSTAMVRDDAATYLSLSTEPAETLLERAWPCRLLRVEPVGKVLDSDLNPHKRCAGGARVVAEVEPWRALGPNGRLVAAVIDRCERLTDTEARSLAPAPGATRSVARDAARYATRYVARDAAGDAAWFAARDAARDVSRYAARAAVVADRITAVDAAGDAAWYAAEAVVVADLITAEQYATLTGPLVSIVGPLDELPVPAWVDEPITGGA